ncbi:MAG: hypothetical protein M3P96_03020 [Actinomycetota bacterium]|nr:hypothetical protein [Actinomycetota bacterium]
MTDLGPEGAWDDAWSAALDDLELDVARVELLLQTSAKAEAVPPPSPEAWVPPAGLGPLPTSLRARAEALLERQTAAAEALVRAMLGNRRHAAFLERIETGDGGDVTPAYLDRSI